ncbi:hypothetical protein ACHAXN_000303 [Cyclotella atomus]
MIHLCANALSSAQLKQEIRHPPTLRLSPRGNAFSRHLSFTSSSTTAGLWAFSSSMIVAYDLFAPSYRCLLSEKIQIRPIRLGEPCTYRIETDSRLICNLLEDNESPGSSRSPAEKDEVPMSDATINPIASYLHLSSLLQISTKLWVFRLNAMIVVLLYSTINRFRRCNGIRWRLRFACSEVELFRGSQRKELVFQSDQHTKEH